MGMIMILLRIDVTGLVNSLLMQNLLAERQNTVHLSGEMFIGR